MTQVASHPSTSLFRLRDFADFYRSHHVAIARSLRRTFGDLAEEAVQDAFILALEKWDSVTILDAPEAWVRVVAKRLAARRLHREIDRASREAHSNSPSIVPPCEPEIDLHRAIDGLPDHMRSAVLLHYLEDLSVAEVAELLGCSTSAAKVWLYRARERLAPIGAGLEGRWAGERRWTSGEVEARAAEVGTTKQLDTLMVDFPALRLMRTISFTRGKYEIGASDGRWLDGGRYTLHSGRLTLDPSTVTGTVILSARVDGDQVSFRYRSHTTPDWHGYSDRIAMAMILEAEIFSWAGGPGPP